MMTMDILLISLRTRRVAFHFNDDLLGVTARRRKLIRRRALLFRKSPRVCRSLRCPSRRSGHPRLFLRSSSVMRPHVRQDVRDLIRHRSLLGTGRPARLDDALYRRRNVARVAELWPLPGQNLAHHSSLRHVSEGHASLINLPQSHPERVNVRGERFTGQSGAFGDNCPPSHELGRGQRVWIGCTLC